MPAIDLTARNSQSTSYRRNTWADDHTSQENRGRDGPTGNVPHVCADTTTDRQGDRTEDPSKEAHREKCFHILGQRLADESEKIHG